LVVLFYLSSGSQLVEAFVDLTDLKNFPHINSIMANFIKAPYPARAAIEVSGLPKGASVEIEAVMVVE
jgi:enamine deaminase RidA (YjgF/YER057c/UK114 family)